ncbi:TPA: hypothetical protein ACS740_003514, partial [Providencia alcalifaciens]
MKLPKSNINTSSIQKSSIDYIAEEKNNVISSSSIRRNIKALRNSQASVIAERFRHYNNLVKQNNSTEDIVTIGAMIQQDLRNYNEEEIDNSNAPAKHSGNKKLSLFQNLLLLTSHIYKEVKSPVISASYPTSIEYLPSPALKSFHQKTELTHTDSYT